MTKSSLPILSQVMKPGSIIMSPSERLAIKSGPRNIAIIAKRSLSAKKGLYAIFFCVEGVAIKVQVKKHHRKVLQRRSTEETEKKSINRNDALPLNLNMSVFYMAMPTLIPPQ